MTFQLALRLTVWSVRSQSERHVLIIRDFECHRQSVVLICPRRSRGRLAYLHKFVSTIRTFENLTDTHQELQRLCNNSFSSVSELTLALIMGPVVISCWCCEPHYMHMPVVEFP